MNASAIPLQRVIELVRLDRRVPFVLADLGITPRYLEWTLESASRDAGVDIERAVARLTSVLAGTPKAAQV